MKRLKRSCAGQPLPAAVLELLRPANGTTPGAVNPLSPESAFTLCEQPEMAGDTWGDAVSYTLALQTSLKICAGRIATLNARRAGLLEKTSEKNDTDVLAVLLVGGGTIAIVIGLGLLFSRECWPRGICWHRPPAGRPSCQLTGNGIRPDAGDHLRAPAAAPQKNSAPKRRAVAVLLP